VIRTPWIHGTFVGAGAGALLAVVHAAGWGVYFALGPAPRDYASAADFGFHVFVTLVVVGTVIAAPVGALTGAFALGRRDAPAAFVVALPLGPLLIAAVLTRIFVGFSDSLVIALPALSLAAAGAFVLAKLTRRR
jgi:hypothetical protein